MMTTRSWLVGSVLLLSTLVGMGCSDDEPGDDASAGAPGAGGSAGSAGTPSVGGSGGTTSNAGTGSGTAGTMSAGGSMMGGSGGMGGSASMGGSAGTTGSTSQDAIGPIVGDRRVAFTPADDVQFIDFFVGHHKDAIEMAQMEVDMGSSETVRAMASKMIAAQTAEIETMQTARMALTGQAESPPAPMDAHMMADMEAMKTMMGEQLDQGFLAHMIAHHAAALAPAHRSKSNLKTPALIAMADQIESDQAKEIGEMVTMLQGPLHEEAAGADTSLEGDRRIPLTPGSDLVFIDFFADHHAKAIEMAKMAAAKASDAAVRAMATKMASNQQKELDQMRAARQELAGSPDTPPSTDPVMAKEMEEMMTLSADQLSARFPKEMIPHHSAGLPPAARAIPHLTRADMKALADSIFHKQAEEVGAMKKMLDGGQK